MSKTQPMTPCTPQATEPASPREPQDQDAVRRSVEHLIDSAKRFTRDLDEAGIEERDRAEFFFD